MGLIAYLRSFTREEQISEVKCDPGGGYNISPKHYSAPGDDGHPLEGDAVACVPTQRTGGYAAIGYIDPKNEQKAEPGGKRIYSRNTAGAQMAEVWLKNSGEIIIQNAAGSFTISPDGDISASNGEGSILLAQDGTVNINGVEIDPDGNVDIPAAAELTAPNAIVEQSLKIGATQAETIGHTHISSSPGSPSGPFPPA